MLLIPKGVVDRIAGGENALRVLREWTQLYISHKDWTGLYFLTREADARNNRSSQKNRGCAQSSA